MDKELDFFNDYIEFASETTDCPEVFHWFISYIIASAIIGKNVHFPFGDNSIYPNLWLILIAPSSEFRKSTALGIAQGIVMKVSRSLILPSRFTEEAFMDMLSTSPQGLIPFYEFKILLDLTKKDYNAGLKSLLTEVYDVPELLIRKTKSAEIAIERPCISIMAATTMEWFLSCCQEDDFTSGFLPRFLFVPVRSKSKDISIPPPADQIKKKSLVDELTKIERISGIMHFSPEARVEHDNWYKKLKERTKIPQFRGIYSRLQIYAIKLSMIHSVALFNSLEIGIISIREATKMIDWLIEEFEGLADSEFAFSKFDKNKKKILRLIQSGKNNRSDILRYSNMSAREFNEIIATLIESERIRVENEERATFYYEQV